MQRGAVPEPQEGGGRLPLGGALEGGGAPLGHGLLDVAVEERGGGICIGKQKNISFDVYSFKYRCIE